MSSCDVKLKNRISRLSDDVLNSCISSVQGQGHSALVKKFCLDVTSQGIDELFSSLLTEHPECKRDLLASVKLSETDLINSMKAALVVRVEGLDDLCKGILAKALDTKEVTTQAICEQVYINGLDGFLSQLAKNRKIDTLADAFGVECGADDAVEQIIDQIFPPPPPPGSQVAPPVPAAQAPPPPPPPPPPSPEPAEKHTHAQQTQFIKNSRPPLQKGITLDDIQNKYWMEELKTFCKDNNIKCAGKKAHLNRAVFNFLNGGELPKTPAKRKAGRGGPKGKKARTAAEPQGDHADEEHEDDEGEGEEGEGQEGQGEGENAREEDGHQDEAPEAEAGAGAGNDTEATGSAAAE